MKEDSIQENEIREVELLEQSKKELFLRDMDKRYKKENILSEEVDFPRKTKFKKVTFPMFEN